jgi:hypothetical protein
MGYQSENPVKMKGRISCNFQTFSKESRYQIVINVLNSFYHSFSVFFQFKAFPAKVSTSDENICLLLLLMKKEWNHKVL